MPNAEKNNALRFVVDESSFDFRGLSDVQIEQYLDEFNGTLQTLRIEDRQWVACAPMWDATRCLEDCELYQFLCHEYPSDVDRDTLRLSYTLLSRCPEWDDSAVAGIDTTVVIEDRESVLALSVAYALAMAFERYCVACVVFPGSPRCGYLPVQGGHGEASIFFFRTPASLPYFWRRLFAFENVPQDEFFDLARHAFPDLVFHSGLAFNRFEGAYQDLRDRVVTILAALNDRFADEYRRCKGRPNEIQAAMGRYHVDLSPESPNTRASRRLMRQREVSHDGMTLRCEWHAKLERHRNRIHFSTPNDELDGKILIAIFTDHLDT